MTTWEYLTTPLLIHNTAAILNNWGKQGWELVQVVPGPEGGLVAYLKRPVGGDTGLGQRGTGCRGPGRQAVRGELRMTVSQTPRRSRHRPARRSCLRSPPTFRRRHTAISIYTSGQLPMVSGALPRDRQGRRRPRPRPGIRCQGLRAPVRSQRHRGRCGRRRRCRPAHRSREAHGLRRIRPRVHRPAGRHQRRQRDPRRDLRGCRAARPLGGGRAGAPAGQPGRGRGRLLVRLILSRAPQARAEASVPAARHRRGCGRSGACAERRS